MQGRRFLFCFLPHIHENFTWSQPKFIVAASPLPMICPASLLLLCFFGPIAHTVDPKVYTRFADLSLVPNREASTSHRNLITGQVTSANISSVFALKHCCSTIIDRVQLAVLTRAVSPLPNIEVELQQPLNDTCLSLLASLSCLFSPQSFSTIRQDTQFFWSPRVIRSMHRRVAVACICLVWLVWEGPT